MARPPWVLGPDSCGGIRPTLRPMTADPATPRTSAGGDVQDDVPASALAALDEATRAIAGVLEIEDVLQLIADRVRVLIGARYAALGIVTPDGRMERFIT